mmetsp:Transcript_10144/g.30423  ORF Transcript_10144/g.30423 Transcript_10144/m.30423 type:complete len:218 (-) Transcript_10144:282-935(-)
MVCQIVLDGGREGGKSGAACASRLGPRPDPQRPSREAPRIRRIVDVVLRSHLLHDALGAGKHGSHRCKTLRIRYAAGSHAAEGLSGYLPHSLLLLGGRHAAIHASSRSIHGPHEDAEEHTQPQSHYPRQDCPGRAVVHQVLLHHHLRRWRHNDGILLLAGCAARHRAPAPCGCCGHILGAAWVLAGLVTHAGRSGGQVCKRDKLHSFHNFGGVRHMG